MPVQSATQPAVVVPPVVQTPSWPSTGTSSTQMQAHTAQTLARAASAASPESIQGVGPALPLLSELSGHSVGGDSQSSVKVRSDQGLGTKGSLPLPASVGLRHVSSAALLAATEGTGPVGPLQPKMFSRESMALSQPSFPGSADRYTSASQGSSRLGQSSTQSPSRTRFYPATQQPPPYGTSLPGEHMQQPASGRSPTPQHGVESPFQRVGTSQYADHQADPPQHSASQPNTARAGADTSFQNLSQPSSARASQADRAPPLFFTSLPPPPFQQQQPGTSRSTGVSFDSTFAMDTFKPPPQPTSARSDGLRSQSYSGGGAQHNNVSLAMFGGGEGGHAAYIQPGSARAFSARSWEAYPETSAHNGSGTGSAYSNHAHESTLIGSAGEGGLPTAIGTGALFWSGISEVAPVAPTGVPFSNDGGIGQWSDGGMTEEDEAMAFFAEMDAGGFPFTRTSVFLYTISVSSINLLCLGSRV